MCISKGKSHKRYEFGQKVSVPTRNRANLVARVDLGEGNPYVATVEKTTGVVMTILDKTACI